MKKLILNFITFSLLFMVFLNPISRIYALSYTPIKIGETQNLKVDKSIGIAAYESSNPYVLSINQKGIAKAKNIGFATVTITTSLGSFQKHFKVVENYPSIIVENLNNSTPKLNKTTVYMSTADKTKLTVLNTNKTVNWTSSNPEVVKVSNKGMLIPQWFGKATITAKVDNKTLKCKVTVLPEEVWMNEYNENLSDKENNYHVSIMKISEKKCRIRLSTVNSKGNIISSGNLYGQIDGEYISFTQQGKYQLYGHLKLNSTDVLCAIIVHGNKNFNISTVFNIKIVNS